VEAVCALCFFGRHYRLATILAGQGTVDLATVEEPFRRLNGEARRPMSAVAFQSCRDTAHRRWVARNHLAWRTDFGRYRPLTT
jgi:hypothetical protein